MRNTGWNFLLTSSLHGTNLTCKTVVNTWQKSSLQLQCINKHVFFGWYYQKSSNLRTFCRKIANFWFTCFRGQFLSKIWMGGSLYFSMTGHTREWGASVTETALSLRDLFSQKKQGKAHHVRRSLVWSKPVFLLIALHFARWEHQEESRRPCSFSLGWAAQSLKYVILCK